MLYTRAKNRQIGGIYHGNESDGDGIAAFPQWLTLVIYVSFEMQIESRTRIMNLCFHSVAPTTKYE